MPYDKYATEFKDINGVVYVVMDNAARDSLSNRNNTLENQVMYKPEVDGESGQLLRSNGDGTTEWVNQGTPTDAQVGDAVSDWLDDHPEATTTVQDGSITKVKLHSDLQETVDEVSELKNEISVKLYNDIVSGTIDGTTGQDGTGNTRCRTNGYIPISDLWYCDLRSTAYGVITFLYDSSKNYIKRLTTTFLLDEYITYESIKENTGASYVRFAFNKSNTTMTSDDCAAIGSRIAVFKSEYGPIVNEELTAQEDAYVNLASINSNLCSTNYIDYENGGIAAATGQNANTTIRCRTKGYIPVDKFVCCNAIGSGYKIIAYLYNSQKTYIRRMQGEYYVIDLTRFDIIRHTPDAAYVRIVFTRTDDANISDADLIAVRSLIYINTDVRKVDEDKARFDKQFNYVAYSQLANGDAPANTEEHFLHCANAGTFTALKGDVRNTADSGLIMCHDAGYTFDANNKITAYNSSNKTLIDTLTVAECKALTFAEQFNGKDCHPCDFETFVRICKKYGLICYVTVRDEHIADVVAPEVLRILKLYRMLDRAIVNSFTKSTLEIFRALNSSITLSLVLGHNYIPTNADVNYAYSLGNCNLNLFNVPVDSSVPGTNVEDKLENLLSGSDYTAVLEYAHSKNVVLYDAQTGNASPDVLLRHGIVGAHMTIIPVWDWKRT